MTVLSTQQRATSDAANIMTAAIEEENASNQVDTCNVVVIYDNLSARERAMAACDYLVKQFWENVELKFHWWRMDFLGDLSLAEDAALNAIASDFLIVCLDKNQTGSATLETWFKTWIARRKNQDGALLDLSANHQLSRFLQNASARSGFDYLSPASNVSAFGASSSAREDNYPHSRPPSRFGLNE